MRLNLQKFTLLSAAGAGAVYSVCALFVALWPGFSTKLMGWLFHLSNAEAVFGSMRVSFAGYVGGVAEVLIYSYAVSLIFVWIFNQSVEHHQ